MNLRARLADLARGRDAWSGSGARCAADWRRPGGYWRCARPAGHAGRHRMRRADEPVGRRDGERAGRASDGGVAAGGTSA